MHLIRPLPLDWTLFSLSLCRHGVGVGSSPTVAAFGDWDSIVFGHDQL